LKAADQYGIDIIVRITADCPLIDPNIIDTVISEYRRLNNENAYVSNTIERTFPRGMDVEIFSKNLLQWSRLESVSAFNREHVTPAIRSTSDKRVIKNNIKHKLNLSAYRFTVDYPKDFYQIKSLLEHLPRQFNFDELMNVAKEKLLDWHDNSENIIFSGTGTGTGTGTGAGTGTGNFLFDQKSKTNQKHYFSRLGLGSAQFGMYYGKFNQDGVPSIPAVQKILEKAQSYGMNLIDTAPAYGKAEEVIGSCSPVSNLFSLVTKTPQIDSNNIKSSDALYLNDVFQQSLVKSGRSSIYGLLIHDPKNLLQKNSGYIYDALISLKDRGLVTKIGVSIYSGETAEAILQKYPIDLVQLPINVLDRRLNESGVLSRLTDSGVEIHARSIFLQGLLLVDPCTLGSEFLAVKNVLEKFQLVSKNLGIHPAHLAIMYLLNIPDLSKILIGVESLDQFSQIIDGMSFDGLGEIYKALDDVCIEEPKILNPYLWAN
jgi:aryl-alcohol dehydrogenase-like predicted oxidoreductase